MAKINTLNYQTVAAWNGSQDLFVVEQPDGTKVATPALLKQYVLAGVTETSEQYAECSTARNVAAKTVTLPGFKLKTGARISVRFTDTSSSNPASGNITLNVNGTGAKEIVDGHANMTKVTYTYGWIFNGNLVNDFIYDGTYWVYMNRDNNTTYTSKAAASGGTATSLCTTGEKYTWNNKQSALTFDNVPTQNSNNPVKSGGIYSKIGDLTQTGLTGDSVAAQLTQLDDKISNKIKIVSATVGTSADGIGAVFYNSDIKRGKVISVYLDNPASTYRFCTMMVNPVPDKFYVFVYNYNLAPVANTTVTLRVVCYE